MLHRPVMLRECLEYLGLRPDGIYLEATCGMGGHTLAIARELTTGFVVSCDRDRESLELAQANARLNIGEFAERIRFRQTTFSRLAEALSAEGLTRVDGLLADLGVSKYQLTSS